MSFSKSPQASRNYISILVDHNNVVVWIVSARPLISKSSSTFNNPSVTASIAPVTIGINVTFIFYTYFLFPSGVKVFILLFTFFQFYTMVSRDRKVHNFGSSLFLLLLLLLLLFNIKSSRLAAIWWSACMSKFHKSFVCLILRDRCCVVHIPSVRGATFQFLHHPKWFTLPT